MQYKMIREYSFRKGILNCVSTPLIGDERDEGWPIYLSFLVEPRDPANLDCMRFRIQSHSDVSPSFILKEAEFFINTLKTMYEL